MSMDREDMRWFTDQFNCIRDAMDEKHTEVVTRLTRVETRVNGTVNDVTELKKDRRSLVKTLLGLLVAGGGGGGIGAYITKFIG